MSDSSPSRLRRWIATAGSMSLLLLILAAWVGVFGAVIELQALYELPGWQQREGVLTQSYARHTRGSKGYYWKWEVAGDYLDDGTRFGIGRIGYGVEYAFSGGQTRAETLADRYPVGTRVTVYADPERPRRAILHRDNTPRATWLALGLCLAVGLLPLWLWLWLWGRRRKQA